MKKYKIWFIAYTINQDKSQVDQIFNYEKNEIKYYEKHKGTSQKSRNEENLSNYDLKSRGNREKKDTSNYIKHLYGKVSKSIWEKIILTYTRD